jgi:hypothetical protein
MKISAVTWSEDMQCIDDVWNEVMLAVQTQKSFASTEDSKKNPEIDIDI